jgi:hypothetical protein
VRVGEDEYCRPVLGLPHTDGEGWLARAKVAFGTVSAAFVEAEIGRLLNALRSRTSTLPLETEVNAALAVIEGLQPRNEAEAMLACQMALAHVTAVELLARLSRMDPGLSPDQAQAAGTVAAKLMRTVAGHYEVLTKARKPAVQVVRVERVNVEAGAQAIVGAVTGAGAQPETGGQPYEAHHERAREPQNRTALRGENPGGLTVRAGEGCGPDAVSPPRRCTRQRRSAR